MSQDKQIELRRPAPNPAVGETATTSEQLPRSPRIVIYGNRVSGAFDLHELVTQSLEAQGITGITVEVNRYVRRIEDAFFGRHSDNPTEAAALYPAAPTLPAGTESAEAAKPRGDWLRRIGSVLGRSTVESTVATSAPDDTEASAQIQEVPADTVPLGVLILPEMRDRDARGTGLTFDTPVEKIQELADAHGVPVVYVTRDQETPAGITAGVNELMQLPQELPPAR